MGEHPLDLEKTGLRSILVVGEIRQCHRIDELLKPNWPPRPPRTPGDPPGDPQEGLEIDCIFLIFLCHAMKACCNLLAVPPGRFAARGDGSPRLTRCLNVLYRVYTSLTMGAGILNDILLMP